MKRRNLILAIALLLTFIFSTSILSAQTENTTKIDFNYQKLNGKIGNHSIVMDLKKNGGDLSGSYYYVKSGISLSLSGEINEDGSFRILELDESNNKTGYFIGQISKEMAITGTCTNIKNNKTLPYTLENSKDNLTNIILEQRHGENCIEIPQNEKMDLEDDLEEEGVKCTTLDLKMIQITTASPKVGQKINQTIVNAILALDFREERYTSIDSLMNSVNSSTYDEGYERVISNKFLSNDKNILSIEINQRYYSFSAAHPNEEGYDYNFNLQTGEIISLDELFIPNYNTKLNKIGKDIFIEIYGSKNYCFEEDGFELNKNFRIMPTGLWFLFNTYEISPNWVSNPFIFIPYKKINHLIKPNGLLEPWRKK